MDVLFADADSTLESALGTSALGAANAVRRTSAICSVNVALLVILCDELRWTDLHRSRHPHDNVACIVWESLRN